MARRIERNEAAGVSGGPEGGTSDAQSPKPVVVITGSTRGLGFALAQEFLRRGCQVLVSGRSGEAVREALGRLHPYRQHVHGQACDVTDPAQVGALWDGAVWRWGRVDIWINNAGVAQEYLRAWELSTEEVIRIVETNILGVMHGSRTAMRGMRAQGGGAIYNVEGWGSDGKRRDGLTVYGTTKQAVRYFTRGLADEALPDEASGDASSGNEASGDEVPGQKASGDRAPGDGAAGRDAAGREASGAVTGSGGKGSADGPRGRVLVGTLSPGMMVTDFLLEPMERMADAERMRRVVNILGDRPETVAGFLVARILANRRNHAHIVWLTGPKVMGRFLGALVRGRSRRRDLFGANGTPAEGRSGAG